MYTTFAQLFNVALKTENESIFPPFHEGHIVYT